MGTAPCSGSRKRTKFNTGFLPLLSQSTPASGSTLRERLLHYGNHSRQVLRDQRRLHPHDPIPKPRQPPVPARVRVTFAPVAPAVDLHDELHRRRQKIRNLPPSDRHLPAEVDPELACRECLPEQLFGKVQVRAMLPRAKAEQSETLWRGRGFGKAAHSSLLAAGVEPGAAPARRRLRASEVTPRCVTRRSWRATCASSRSPAPRRPQRSERGAPHRSSPPRDIATGVEARSVAPVSYAATHAPGVGSWKQIETCPTRAPAARSARSRLTPRGFCSLRPGL